MLKSEELIDKPDVKYDVKTKKAYREKSKKNE